MKCLNVIIYYDNEKEIQEYVHNCMINNNRTIDIAIVINSNKKNRAKFITNELQKKYNNIFVYDYSKNVGYLNSILSVIQEEELEEYEYYILSNTDITYETDEFYHKLLNKKYVSSIGCIAPSVYSTKTKSFSNPHYYVRTSKSKLKWLSFIFTYPRLGRFYLFFSGLKRRKKGVEKESCFVYSPHGCFMIFTKDFVRKICGYEYGVTLYSEEACVGELLRKNNMNCFFDNSLRVLHNESTITGKIDYKKRFKYWKESIDYIIREFY